MKLLLLALVALTLTSIGLAADDKNKEIKISDAEAVEYRTIERDLYVALNEKQQATDVWRRADEKQKQTGQRHEAWLKKVKQTYKCQDCDFDGERLVLKPLPKPDKDKK